MSALGAKPIDGIGAVRPLNVVGAPIGADASGLAAPFRRNKITLMTHYCHMLRMIR